MKTLSNLLATLLILSATFWAAGWIQEDDSIANIHAEVDVSAKWEITAPRYANPELGQVISGYGNPVRIQVILHESILDLNVKYKNLSGKGYVRAFSLTAVDDDGGRICFVHIIEPEDWNDKQQFQSLGHEMMHCLGADHTGVINEKA